MPTVCLWGRAWFSRQGFSVAVALWTHSVDQGVLELSDLPP